MDSEKIYFGKLQNLLHDTFDLNIPLEELYAYIGLDLSGILRQLITDYHLSISLEKFHQIHDDYDQNIYLKEEMQLEKGLVELLTDLRKNACDICIVTSAEAADCLLLLNRFRLLPYFDGLVSQEMVDHSKPEPDLYHLAMKYFNKKPEQCVAIEDSPNGILAAKRAGLFTIAYTGGTVVQDVSKADIEVSELKKCLSVILDR